MSAAMTNISFSGHWKVIRLTEFLRGRGIGGFPRHFGKSPIFILGMGPFLQRQRGINPEILCQIVFPVKNPPSFSNSRINTGLINLSDDAEPGDGTADDGQSLCTTDDVQPWCDETTYDGQSTNERNNGGMQTFNSSTPEAILKQTFFFKN